jgi:hypothetical protein
MPKQKYALTNPLFFNPALATCAADYFLMESQPAVAHWRENDPIWSVNQ